MKLFFKGKCTAYYIVLKLTVSAIPRVLIGFEMFYKHSRFFIAFNQYADNFYSSPSILIIFLLFLFALFRMSCVTSIFRERLLKVGVKIVFTD